MALDLTAMQTHPLIVSTSAPPGLTDTHNGATSHHKFAANEARGHQITPHGAYPGAQQLTITPAGHGITYLPYFQDAISSVMLRRQHGPSIFVTDNMSGCCLFIAETTHNRLIVFHANSQRRSSRADMTGQAANHQHPDALRHLDTLARTALPETFGQRIVANCSKIQYNAVPARTATTDDFLGGTTIAGFRNAGVWSFHYQTWGSIRGSALAVLECRQFYQGP